MYSKSLNFTEDEWIWWHVFIGWKRIQDSFIKTVAQVFFILNFSYLFEKTNPLFRMKHENAYINFCVKFLTSTKAATPDANSSLNPDSTHCGSKAAFSWQKQRVAALRSFVQLLIVRVTYDTLTLSKAACPILHAEKSLGRAVLAPGVCRALGFVL